MEKPNPVELKIRIGLFVWIFIANITALVALPHEYLAWPMWFASIYYFVAGMTVKAAKEAFCGGFVGLVLTYALGFGFVVLAPVLGELLAISILLFIILGVIIVGGAYCPLFLNNAAFAYLTIAAIDLATIGTNFVNYVIVLIVGGGILVGGCLLIIGAIMKSAGAAGAHG